MVTAGYRPGRLARTGQRESKFRIIGRLGLRLVECKRLGEDVHCEIWDEDTGRMDDLMGTFTIPAKVLDGVERLKDDEEINWQSEAGVERAGETATYQNPEGGLAGEISKAVLRATGCCRPS